MSEFAKYAACLDCGSDEWEEANGIILCRECGEER